MSASFSEGVSTGWGLFSGHVAVAGAAIDSNSMIYVPAGTATDAQIRMHKGVATTVPVCGNMSYDGHLCMDMCGGLRTYVDTHMFIQPVPYVIANTLATPHLEYSLLGLDANAIGTRILPSYSLKYGKIIRLKNRSLLSYLNNKTSTMRFSIGASTVAVPLTYVNSGTAVYAEIEVDFLVSSVAGDLATVTLIGRTLFGTGPTGSAVGSRYITGTINNIDITISNELKVTFQWDDGDTNAGNHLISQMNTLQYLY